MRGFSRLDSHIAFKTGRCSKSDPIFCLVFWHNAIICSHRESWCLPYAGFLKLWVRVQVLDKELFQKYFHILIKKKFWNTSFSLPGSKHIIGINKCDCKKNQKYHNLPKQKSSVWCFDFIHRTVLGILFWAGLVLTTCMLEKDVMVTHIYQEAKTRRNHNLVLSLNAIYDDFF